MFGFLMLFYNKLQKYEKLSEEAGLGFFLSVVTFSGRIFPFFFADHLISGYEQKLIQQL